jgi:hypothetical protein
MQDDRKPAVLLLHLGVDGDPSVVHDDYKIHRTILKQQEIVDVIEANFLTENFEELFLTNNICAVDTHHLRLWQKRWNTYEPIFRKLQGIADKHCAILLNDLAMFEWNLSKANYLRDIQASGIEVIPTHYVEASKKEETFLSVIAKSAPNGLVIKPSSGMRASGIHFVKQSGPSFLITSPTTPDSAKSAEHVNVDTLALSAHELDEWVQSYCSKFGQDPVLVQDLIEERLEVSVIVLKGARPYAILRTQGDASGIAHEAFGGQNISLEVVPTGLLRFAHDVISALPSCIRNQGMHRVDILVSPSHKGIPSFMLLEIESAGPRLFVPESKQYSLFPLLLVRIAVEQSQIKLFGADNSAKLPLATTNVELSSPQGVYNYLSKLA